ncbi:MAG: DUF5333 domain-containing protein [Rhodobacterales bacterium]|nr:DUF5333 domain-containing protein [Rhodobacterales bacterium]
MTLKPMLKMIGLIAGMALIAGITAARPPLAEVELVREGIITAGIAYEIGDKCGPIDARMLRGYAFLNSLKTHAQSLGYSDAEIEAYVGDRAEKRRLEAIARERLAAMGAVAGEPETYCALGRAEIAAGSQIGQLLR